RNSCPTCPRDACRPRGSRLPWPLCAPSNWLPLPGERLGGLVLEQGLERELHLHAYLQRIDADAFDHLTQHDHLLLFELDRRDREGHEGIGARYVRLGRLIAGIRVGPELAPGRQLGFHQRPRPAGGVTAAHALAREEIGATIRAAGPDQARMSGVDVEPA